MSATLNFGQHPQNKSRLVLLSIQSDEGNSVPVALDISGPTRLAMIILVLRIQHHACESYDWAPQVWGNWRGAWWAQGLSDFATRRSNWESLFANAVIGRPLSATITSSIFFHREKDHISESRSEFQRTLREVRFAKQPRAAHLSLTEMLELLIEITSGGKMFGQKGCGTADPDKAEKQALLVKLNKLLSMVQKPKYSMKTSASRLELKTKYPGIVWEVAEPVKYFSGRKSFYSQIFESISRDSTSRVYNIHACLNAEGGVGKTQLARAFANWLLSRWANSNC